MIFPSSCTHKRIEEYALARTERNTAVATAVLPVHAAPDVTLEADLGPTRSYYQFNSNTCRLTRGLPGSFPKDVVDPHGGRDIAAKVLRHVTPPFGKTRCASCAWPVLLRALPTFTVI